MSEHQFQFSAAAHLYAGNLHVINQIQESQENDARRLIEVNIHMLNEMRMATYRSIAEFGDAVIRALTSQELNDSITHLPGGHFHSLFKGKDGEPGSDGYIWFALPDPRCVQPKNDTAWQNHWGAFDIVDKHRLFVWLAYDKSDSQTKDRIYNLAKTTDLGKYIESGKYGHRISMSFNADNPVVSASQKLTVLIDRVYDVVAGVK